MTTSKSFDKKRFIVSLVLTLSALLGFGASLWVHAKQTGASKSSVPKQRVYHSPLSIVAQLEHDPKRAEKVFKIFCAACHDNPPEIQLNTPLIGDSTAWRTRENLGTDALLALTIKGVGAMPARGGCFECNDALLKETIEYMLAQSKRESTALK